MTSPHDEPARRRRVLVIAYECNPHRGSEAGAGFSLVNAMADHADCTVAVGWRDGAELGEWAASQTDPRRIAALPIPESVLGRALFRLHRYPRFLAYLLWLRTVSQGLRELADTGGYDAVWHVTYSPYWLPTPLRHLHDTPTIWGPVTGGDRTPRELRSLLGARARFFEGLDILATGLLRRLPSVRASHRNIGLVLSSLERSEVYRLRDGKPVWSFPQSVLAHTEPDESELDGMRGSDDVLCFVSPLRPQKGALLALQAVARDERINVVFAPPPERKLIDQYRRVAADLGVSDRVRFEELKRPEMLRLLRRSKGVIHTATNDSSSMALSEALALGVPVVGLDVDGTRAICGLAAEPDHIHLASVGDPERVGRELSNLMVNALQTTKPPKGPLIDQGALTRRLGKALDTALDTAATPKRKKIAQVFYALQDRGGEVVARSLADGFERRGHDVTNFAAFRATPMNSSTADFEILYDRRPSTLGNVRYVIDVWRRLRRLKPDVVVLHTDAAQILGAPAAALAGVRTRICVHHLPLGTYVTAFRYLHALLAMVGIYEKTVFVGESAMRDAQKLPRLARRRMSLINNAVGVELGERSSARRRFGIADDAFVFLNVGSFTPQKNHETLIAAMREVPDAILVIAGAGPLDADMRAKAAPLGDRVRFLGRVSPSEMGDVYALADIFVFPSRYEGRPLALLEAVSASLPVIASSIAQNEEVTRDAAAYAPPEDVSAWAALMRRATSDPHFVDDLRRRVKDLEIGTADSMVDAYVKLMR